MRCGRLVVQAQRLMQAVVGSTITGEPIRRISAGFVMKGDSTEREITRCLGTGPAGCRQGQWRARPGPPTLATERTRGPPWAETVGPLGGAGVLGGGVTGTERSAGQACSGTRLCCGCLGPQAASSRLLTPLPAASVGTRSQPGRWHGPVTSTERGTFSRESLTVESRPGGSDTPEV